MIDLIFKIDKFHMSSLEFCSYLANNYQVGLLPCSFFGLNNYVRLCFAIDTKKLITSLNRIEKCIKSLHQKYVKLSSDNVPLNISILISTSSKLSKS